MVFFKLIRKVRARLSKIPFNSQEFHLLCTHCTAIWMTNLCSLACLLACFIFLSNDKCKNAKKNAWEMGCTSHTFCHFVAKLWFLLLLLFAPENKLWISFEARIKGMVLVCFVYVKWIEIKAQEQKRKKNVRNYWGKNMIYWIGYDDSHSERGLILMLDAVQCILYNSTQYTCVNEYANFHNL